MLKAAFFDFSITHQVIAANKATISVFFSFFCFFLRLKKSATNWYVDKQKAKAEYEDESKAAKILFE